MLWMVLGLAGFLGLHCVRVVAPGWREAMIHRLGANGWKGLYSLAALVFFVLLVWGFGQARAASSLVWLPPPALRHVGYGLVLLAFVLLVAAYVPGNGIRARLRHPMLIGTALWTGAHLMMSGLLHAMIVFGAFLAWSLLTLVDAWRRPQPADGRTRLSMTLLTVVIGVLAYLAFALWLHRWLIGVAPMPV